MGGVDHVTIPVCDGVEYQIDDVPVAGRIDVRETVVITAVPLPGRKLKDGAETEWIFTPREDDSFED